MHSEVALGRGAAKSVEISPVYYRVGGGGNNRDGALCLLAAPLRPIVEYDVVDVFGTVLVIVDSE